MVLAILAIALPGPPHHNCSCLSTRLKLMPMGLPLWSGESMRFSIIIPVLNEEAVLERQLVHLTRQCARHDFELLIVDGGSHDSTVTVAKRYGQVICSSRGRATQMNAGVSTA